MSLLGGGAAALFGELLGPQFLAGRVWQGAESYDPDGTLNRGNDAYDCLVQVDSVTERMAAAEGYTTTDRALYVLRASYDGPFDTDCEVTVDAGPYAGTRWRVASPIEGDAGGAYWLCRGVLGGADPDYPNPPPANASPSESSEW